MEKILSGYKSAQLLRNGSEYKCHRKLLCYSLKDVISFKVLNFN